MGERSRTLVVGATAGTGLLVVKQLLAEGALVRVLVRNKAKAEVLFGDRVELSVGDLARPDQAFRDAFREVHDVVFTAGVASGRPAKRALIKAVEQEGTVAAIDAARTARITGRFLYMNTMGKGDRTLFMRFLNVMKPGLSQARTDVENAIRASGLSYVIVRASVLINSVGGRKPLRIFAGDAPLHPWMLIPRADVARVITAILRDTAFRNKEISVTRGGPSAEVEKQLSVVRTSSSAT